jgi:hypothetical protein
MATNGNNITTAYVDLATYDEIEKYIYGGRLIDRLISTTIVVRFRNRYGSLNCP